MVARKITMAWLVLALTVLALGFFPAILAPLEHRSGNLHEAPSFSDLPEVMV